MNLYRFKQTLQGKSLSGSEIARQVRLYERDSYINQRLITNPGSSGGSKKANIEVGYVDNGYVDNGYVE